MPPPIQVILQKILNVSPLNVAICLHTMQGVGPFPILKLKILFLINCSWNHTQFSA